MDRFTAKNGATYAFREQPGCSGCAFDIKNGCTRTDDAPCSPTLRPDKKSGIWVRIGMEPVASDLAPREALLAHIADLTAERDELRAQVHIVTSERDELAQAMADMRKNIHYLEGLRHGWSAHAADLAQHIADMTAERDELLARERACPTMPEAEARALMRGEMADALTATIAAAPVQAEPADPRTPPPGCRLLGDYEPAQAGDMAYIGGIGGAWRPVRRRMGIIGSTMDELSDGARVLALARPMPLTRAVAGGPAPAAEPADGCGACGDACKSRGSCRLAEESPTLEMINAEPDHLEDERGMVCRCGPDGCSDSVACPRAGGAA